MKDPWDILMKVPEALSETEREIIQSIYMEKGRDTFLKEASERKIVPFVAESCCYLGIDKEYWKELLSQYEIRTKQIIKMLDELFCKFETHDCISPCITENFGALLVTGKHMGCFCSGDVDISADYLEKDKIRAALIELGYTEVKRKDYHSNIEQDEYICPEQYLNDFYINLVWKPVIREKAYTINQKKMIVWMENERKKASVYDNTKIRILSPEAMLIHCIYHISAGHYYCASPGVRLLTEIDRIIRTNFINWDNIWERAKELQITKRIQIALIITAKVLDTPSDRYIVVKPVTKSVKKLTDGFYQNKDGIMTVIEPVGFADRLKTDIISDRGPFIPAMIRKTVYAISWFLIKLRRK